MASPAPSNRIERAHQMYREGRYDEALQLYTEALSVARTMPHKIALHSNRAACFLKLHLFTKAVKECTSVLELDHNHTGALMLRAQTLVTLKDYHSALFDVSQLIDLDPLSEVYQNLQARLKTQLSLAPIPESEAELEEEEEKDEVGSCNLGVRAQETISRKNMETAAVEHDGSSDSSKGNSVKCHGIHECSELQTDCRNMEDRAPEVTTRQEDGINSSNGWQTIPKPKGHATLDYARWDKVVDESSEDDDDDEEDECQPQYRFRVRTVGVRPVK